MDVECFRCEGLASDRYTVIADSKRVIEDKVLCGGCVAELRKQEGTEVRESPAHMRGARKDPEEYESI